MPLFQKEDIDLAKFILHEISLRPGCESDLRAAAADRLFLPTEEIKDLRIVRKSLDARKKQDIVFKYSVVVTLKDSLTKNLLQKGFQQAEEPLLPETVRGGEELRGEAVVVGAGPCGLFAAYLLAREGYRPLLIERGRAIEARSQDFALLRREGKLDPESNACFGEGGAGAFSDGKLTARTRDPRTEQIFSLFIKHGAPEEVRYLAKPHLGTDGIRKIVAGLRGEICSLGGQVRYQARLSGIEQDKDGLAAITYIEGGKSFRIETSACILAIGHSARDTFFMLQQSGVELQKKPFALGVRVEHPRSLIDERQYGRFAPALGAADYALRASYGSRGVYSFCMCPGGEVICSATEEGHTAVNGMSWYHREGEFSNSALVVSVGEEDMPSGPLGGIELQRGIEAAAYALAHGYGAPVATYRDFIMGQGARSGAVKKNSYLPYATWADLGSCLPGFAREGIAHAAKSFDAAIPGFVAEGLLLGTETRTSSPVRIPRGEGFCSNVAGLYPAGEGAGYAGGILSSAVDGLKAAEKIIGKFRPNGC